MTELTQYVYAFDKANEPIARAKDGDEFSFRTLDCYSGQVCTEEDIVGESFNFSRTNPATGPLYVEGAMWIVPVSCPLRTAKRNSAA